MRALTGAEKAAGAKAVKRAKQAFLAVNIVVLNRACESVRLFDGEGEPVAIEGCKSQAGALLTLSLDPPSFSVSHDLHLAPFPPPLIDFAGKGDPECALGAQLREVIQQRLVCVSRPLFDDVVRVDDKTRQAMFLGDQGDLPFPEINRVVVQNVEEQIVLRGGQRQLENLADEKGEDGAAVASLRLQVSEIGDRHVVGEVQRLEPLWLAVHPAKPRSPTSFTLPLRWIRNSCHIACDPLPAS